jgi:hypothetical protein
MNEYNVYNNWLPGYNLLDVLYQVPIDQDDVQINTKYEENLDIRN